MRHCDTFTEALKSFLLHLSRRMGRGKMSNGTYTKRYTVRGSVVRFSKYKGVNSTLPRATWISLPPPEYVGIPLNDCIREYLTPYATRTEQKKETVFVDVREKPMVMDHGVRTPTINDRHYAALLATLKTKQLFPGEQTEMEA